MSSASLPKLPRTRNIHGTYLPAILSNRYRSSVDTSYWRRSRGQTKQLAATVQPLSLLPSSTRPFSVCGNLKHGYPTENTRLGPLRRSVAGPFWQKLGYVFTELDGAALILDRATQSLLRLLLWAETR